MILSDLIEHLDLKLVCGQTDKQVSGVYCGDLLSRVMGHAPADCAWITVMGNLNAVAVSVLADTACIILCEAAALDDDALEKAKQQQVTILKSELPAAELCIKIGALLQNEQ